MLRLLLFNLIFLSSAFAQAQNSMWGTGMWGGMQSCGFNTRAGQGVNSSDDGTQELREELADAKLELSSKKSDKKQIDRKLERARQNIESALAPEYADFIIQHMENAFRCSEYRGFANERNPQSEPYPIEQPPGFKYDDPNYVEGSETTPRISGSGGTQSISGFTTEEWRKVCDPSKPGGVRAAAACSASFQNSGGRANLQKCRESLGEFRELSKQALELQNDIESLTTRIADLKADISDAKKDAREMAATEGGICEECMRRGNNSGGSMQQPQTDWTNVLANLGTGLFATYAGYKTQKMVSDNNASLGWPTQSYPSVGYGYPYIQSALYGALGGGTGQGTFGCGSGMNGTGNMNGPMGMSGMYGMGSPYSSMGGTFGYPNGMMGNTMGGGIYSSGTGPWGMSGPYAAMNNPYGYGVGSMMGLGGMISMGAMTNGYGSMMNGYGNMMGTGSMMTGYDSSYYSYQQQLLQMQMQQQQSYIQKAQAASSIQSEMYSLMMRLQQIQYGYGTGYASGGLTGSYTTTGSSVLTPLPGSPNYGTTPYGTTNGVLTPLPGSYLYQR